MKTILALTLLPAAALLGPGAANAHESVVPHGHPHLHAIDGALLGYDALALIALGLIAAAGIGIVLKRRRK